MSDGVKAEYLDMVKSDLMVTCYYMTVFDNEHVAKKRHQKLKDIKQQNATTFGPIQQCWCGC